MSESGRKKFDSDQFNRGLDASIKEAIDKLRAAKGLPPLDPNRPGPIEESEPHMVTAEEFRRLQQERAAKVKAKSRTALAR